MSPEKLLEFAWGLANSKKPFLWIIRPDLVIGGSVVLSSEFVNEISDRGLITSWCPQEKVLNHPSIGGFLTHCGWNSTIESICAGVPMLCWPFYGDQPTNCRFICNELEIGIEINTDVKREEVEKLVSELMVGEKGKKMREKAIELKKKVEEDTRPGGCSYMNLDKVIKEVLLIQKMSNFAEKKRQPHAVLTPYPLQGHINPMLKFAKLLHLRGFHITFVITEYNHKRLLKSRGPKAFDGFTDFSFETIPDGLTQKEGDGDGDDVKQDLTSLRESVRKNFIYPFRELLAKLHKSAQSGLIPRVTCLVSDSFMSFTIQVAEELELPIALLIPYSACTFMSILQFRRLIERGLIPLKDESYLTNGYLDTKIDWIPGLRNFRLKDLPDFIRTTDPNSSVLEFIIEMVDRFYRASAIVFNTSYELESSVMNALHSMFPSLYTIGPFTSFLNQTPQNQLASLETNLWKEDTKCLEWLESKEPGSVVYVNFGSITIMSSEKLLEFFWGLVNSKKPFLWIIRSDLVIGGSMDFLSEFMNEISDRGLIVGWCPQEKVLNHPSIGGFLTHCGWNSTIESICAGVPMLCWPFFADQPTNCRYICNELEIGIEIDTNVKREGVQKLINELMVGEKGKKMKQKAMELKKKTEEDTKPDGCSYINLDKVIKEVLLKQN
ncbi:cytokinin-O-glucosyltransferase [Trifolium pratense]|uniref:Cytokinin-O-glucosyltransferase n=1 Tax=Trifolium pratense TaxID=57577 RepID=A0A2K3L9L9_TRIPR|nr:cytokinin-O-glucosyltransferase [Trifolium pratense]